MTAQAQTNRLAGQVSFLFIGNAFTLIAGLPFQLYLARALGANGIGAFGLLEAIIAVISSLLGFGVSQTMVRFLPHHLARSEFDAARKLIRLGSAAVVASGLIGFIVVLAARGVISEIWPDLDAYRDSIIVIALTLPIGLILYFATQALRGFQEVRQVVIATSFIQMAIKVAVTIALLRFGWDLLGYVVAVAVSMAVAAAWLVWNLWNRFVQLPATEQSGADRRERVWLNYAGTMYSNSLVAIFAVHMDRFLLGIFAGPAAVGVLMICKTLYSLPSIFLQAFISAAGPMFAESHARTNDSERDRLYHLTTDWLVRLGLPLILFLSLFADPVLGLFGEAFSDKGVAALRILLLGQTINLACGQIGNLLNMSGQERAMLRTSVISTLILLATLPPLVYGFGIEGAAAAATLSVVFNNLAAVRIARRRLGLKWLDPRYAQWVLPTIAAAALAFMSRNAFPEPNVVVIVATLIAVYGVFHGVHASLGLNADDRILWEALRSRLATQRGTP